MTNDLLVGKAVVCYKYDAADDFYGIPEENRWHVGDTFVVQRVESTPWGTFLYDDAGHNLGIRKAALILSDKLN